MIHGRYDLGKTSERAAGLRRRFAWQRRYAYMVLGVSLLGVVAFLLINGTATGRYYITVDELLTDGDYAGKSVRVAGAVDGDTIRFDPVTQQLSFTVVNIPSDGDAIREQGGLAEVLHRALLSPDATRLQVVWDNAELPDLLQHEAQAIMTGKLGDDGRFYADQVLLKCPTRYSDEAPAQAASAE
ncbi:MAG: cytochrome c maturation protein CcmE [Anaerolineae bacterium]|nr:cytochrome c maturation protein CcmE [Anaerolineae bacterium]